MMKPSLITNHLIFHALRIGILTLCQISIAFGNVSLSNKPNVIIILADDLGYGDLSCYNSDSKVQTPHLDQLASEGLMFTDGHSSSAQCSPSRYGLLTGRYSWRTRLQSGVLRHFAKPLIERSEFTMAEMFKACGYQTACIGKWHLGLGWHAKEGQQLDHDSWDAKQIQLIDFTKSLTDSPLDHGFDYFWGQNASNNMLPYCYIKNNQVVMVPKHFKKPVFETEHSQGLRSDDYLSDQIDEMNYREVMKWLKGRKSDQPFFLYFPMSAIHLPCLPTKEFIGKSQAGLRGDKVVEMDDIVGRIMTYLKTSGLEENTIVIFSSDNGNARFGDSIKNLKKLKSYGLSERYGVDHLLKSPHKKGDEIHYAHQPAGPFRGKKLTVYEGGHRVPFLIKWPQKIKAGREYNGLISQLDIFKTLSNVLDFTLPESSAQDSQDMLPILFDQSNKKEKEALISKGWQTDAYAIRQGDWKLVMYQGTYLYNLNKDLGEQNDLSKKFPEKVQTLKNLFYKIKD